MIPMWLIVAHFVGDWFFQFDWMALNKSKSAKALFAHVGVMSLFLLPWGWKFALINFALHLVVDQTTSQWTSKLWFIDLIDPLPSEDGKTIAFGWAEVTPSLRHWFFVVIGLDQLIHYVCLWGTYRLLIGG